MAATILKQNNAEIGLTNGTSVNVGNSGGGGQDALGSSSIGAGNTFVVSSVSPLEGTYSFLVTQTGAVACDQYWALATTYADFSWQFRFSYNQTPAVNCPIFRTQTTTTFTGASIVGYIRTDNKFHVLDAPGAQTVISTGTLTPGTAYMMQGRQNGTSVIVNIYPVGSTTATATVTMTLAAAVVVGSFKMGVNVGSALIALKYDSVKFATGGFIPRNDVANTAPTASVGPAQYVLAGTTVNLTGTDADVDGSVDARAWTWDTTDTTGPAGTTRHWLSGPTITGSTTQNASAVMASPGCYRAKYIVTDDGGLPSAAVFTNIFVYPASGVAVTVRDELRGTWTALGGGGGLNDASDSTGSRSVDNPTGQSDTLLMNPHGPGSSAGAVTFVWRGMSTGGTIHRTVEWYLADGTTLVDSQTADAPTSIGDQTFTMDAGGLAAIPTTDLRAELVIKCKAAI